MNALDGISQLDLYFLAALVDGANLTQHPVLHPRLVPTRGTDWPQKFSALAKAYRAAVDRYLKESAEAALASTAANRLRDRTLSWRRAMEALVREEPDPQRRTALLRAVGYGAGTPRSAKEMKDFYLKTGSAVAANEAALVALGATAAQIAWGKHALTEEEAASLSVAKERAEAEAARAEVNAQHTAMLEFTRSIFRAAAGARDLAVFEDNAANQKAADDVLARLEQSVAQARVESRKRAATQPVPTDVVTPVDTGGTVPNGGNG